MLFLLFTLALGNSLPLDGGLLDDIPKLPADFAMSTWFFQWHKGFYVYPSNSTSDSPLFTLTTYCPNWSSAPSGSAGGVVFLETSFNLGDLTYTLTYNDNTTRYIYQPILGKYDYDGKSYSGLYFLLDKDQKPLFYLPWQFIWFSFDFLDMDGGLAGKASRDLFWATWFLSLKGIAATLPIDAAVMTHLFESHYRNTSRDSCTGMLFYGVPAAGILFLICCCGCCWFCWKRRRGSSATTYEVVGQ